MTRAAIARDLPTLGYIGNPIDPWGATDERVAYPACLDALRRVGRLRRPGDRPRLSRTARCPARCPSPRAWPGTSSAATASRPDVLPVYVSLTSGEPTPEILAMLDAAGGIPVLRGTTEALAAIAGRATWEARRAARAIEGPRRPGWPALAQDRTALGHDPAFRPSEMIEPGDAAERSKAGARVMPELESLGLLGAAGLPVVEARPVPDGADSPPGRRGHRLSGGPQARRDPASPTRARSAG